MKLLIVEKEPPEADEEMATHRISATNYSSALLSTDAGPPSCYSPSVATSRSGSRSTGPSHMYDLNTSPSTSSLANYQSRNSVFQLDDDKEAILVSGGLDNMIKIWDADTGMEKRTLFGYVESILIHPSSKADDKLLQSYRRCLGRRYRYPATCFRLSWYEAPLEWLARFSADNCTDRTIKIWDRESGRCAQTLVGHRGGRLPLSLKFRLLTIRACACRSCH